MKVMVLVKSSQESEAGVLPTTEMFEAMGKYNEELVKAGIMLAGEGLHPSSKGRRVRFSGSKRTVIDGPFTETKELVAGYWLWQVKSMDEAVEWLKRCPNPMESDSDVEIRQVYTSEDFGEVFTPELQAREDAIRGEIDRYSLEPPRFEQGRAMTIVGPNETYTFETRKNIPEQWHRFAPQIGKVPGQLGKATYGVCWNYKPGVGFDYLAGVEVGDASKKPTGYSEVRLPAQRYAVFTHRKHVSKLPETLDAIWMKWLPNSGHEASAAPSFERYTEEFNPETGLGGTEVWVPLAK